MSSQQPPPPRKGNCAKVLKNLHTEQLSKIQWKHQQEAELLEDIKNFIKQKCAVEKSYGEAMQKISAGYLNKKMPPIQELNQADSNQQWTVWSVWRSLLEETDKLAKAKLAAVEIFQAQIGEDVKGVRQNKMQLAKKNLDLLKVVQGEVQSCVTELDKLKKVYMDDEHVSHDARDKAREAEEKLKKKKGSIFQSISSLQKTSAKLGSRRELCEEKSTQARNAYLLQIASANAHQNRYFHVDLHNIIKTLDGGIYEKLAEYFSILSRTELLTCSATQTSFSKIKEHASTINRDYDYNCFINAFPVLNQHITYEFEPCDNDSVTTVDQGHGAGSSLMQSGRQYASRVVQETKKIRESVRALDALQKLKDQGMKNDPNEPNGPDIDTKMDELKNQIRRSETAKIKAEARLECLCQGGVKVDDFLQDAEGLATLGLMRSSSQLSFRESAVEESEAAESTSQSGQEMSVHEDDEEEVVADESEISIQNKIAEMKATWQDPTTAWEDANSSWDTPAVVQTTTAAQIETNISEDTVNQSSLDADGQANIVKCIALYAYTAQNADELSMMENEELEVLLAYSEGDGWVKARNYKGEEGYVPQNYLDLHIDDQVPAEQEVHDEVPDEVHDEIQEETQEEVHEEAHEVQEEVHEAISVQPTINAIIEETEPELEHEAETAYGLENQISFSSVDYTYQQQGDADENWPGPSDEVTDEPPMPDPPTALELDADEAVIGYCRALYDYDATSDEELTFYEGEIIAILRRSNVHGEDVDDGWWEGRLLPDGPKGVFPSLVVEECGPNGEEITPKGTPAETPDGESAPPPPGTPPIVPNFLLPPERVIITQPTPETEFPTSHEHLFDQNATIKESDDDELADINAEMVRVEPATPPEEQPPTEVPSNDESNPVLAPMQIVITASTPMVEDKQNEFGNVENHVQSEEQQMAEEEAKSEPPPPPAPEQPPVQAAGPGPDATDELPAPPEPEPAAAAAAAAAAVQPAEPGKSEAGNQFEDSFVKLEPSLESDV